MVEVMLADDWKDPVVTGPEAVELTVNSNGEALQNDSPSQRTYTIDVNQENVWRILQSSSSGIAEFTITATSDQHGEVHGKLTLLRRSASASQE